MQRRARLLLTTAAVVLAATAACGDGEGGTGVATLSDSTTSTTDRRAGGGGGGGSAATGISAEFEDAMVEFAGCMRDNGIDFPDPGDGGGLIIGPGSDIDPEDPEFQAAEAECKPILDEAEKSMPKPSEEELAEMRDSMLEFARCMREEGVDFPDPEFGEGGRVTARMGDPDDPDFEAAQEKCADESGGFGVPQRAPAARGRG
jgi:hypothetical protein